MALHSNSNDARGWVMACISGVACVLGASVICVDVLIRLLPAHRSFSIRNSDGFLSCSLSLSAGVMLYSALNNMLPHAKQYLESAAYSPRAAAWLQLATFLGGVFGIQLFSRLCHYCIPHHAVDCDHDHPAEHKHAGGDEEQHHHLVLPDSRLPPDELSPLLHDPRPPPVSAPGARPPLQERLTSSVTKIVTMPKENCDADGPCHGWTDPCGTDCFQKVGSAGKTSSIYAKRKTASLQTPTTPVAAESPLSHSGLSADADAGQHALDVEHDHDHGDPADPLAQSTHHHHVPDNAFLSISLQTSIAIALHKLPEGFITYATNHANPTLGLSVFLALFIHNLTEGFALALPIYLATNSRLRALVLSTFLGGLSQPAGAGIAALWLRATEHHRGGDAGDDLNQGVYGCLFGVTAGIMASVAISLIQESFELSHNRNLCMVFIFVGMGLLGMSNALTA